MCVRLCWFEHNNILHLHIFLDLGFGKIYHDLHYHLAQQPEYLCFRMILNKIFPTIIYVAFPQQHQMKISGQQAKDGDVCDVGDVGDPTPKANELKRRAFITDLEMTMREKAYWEYTNSLPIKFRIIYASMLCVRRSSCHQQQRVRKNVKQKEYVCTK